MVCVKVAERRSRINLTVLEDLHGEQFLKAIDIVLVAVSEHIERFAATAREIAATETRESRRDELLTMAKTAILSPTSRRRLSGRRCNCVTSSN